MPKVEIEMSELKKMQDEISQLKEDNMQLIEDLSKLDENTLKEQAVDLSYRLFNNYMEAVFEKLGFEPMNGYAVYDVKYLPTRLGENWYAGGENLDIKVGLGVYVVDQFRSAFLKIGVVPKTQQ